MLTQIGDDAAAKTGRTYVKENPEQLREADVRSLSRRILHGVIIFLLRVLNSRHAILASRRTKESGTPPIRASRKLNPRAVYLAGLLRCRLHRVRGEERSIHRTHVDVPALALRRLESGQIAHAGLQGLAIER